MIQARKMLLACLSLLLLCGVWGCKQKATSPKSSSAGKSATPAVIRVTGIPDENPTALQRKYAPMVAFLQKSLGVPVKYVPVTDYGAAVQALVAGKIDFAWLGGFTHVQARVLSKVEPLVMRDIDRKFQSIFLVHHKAGIASMAQLKGHTFGFGSKSSTSGHLMPRHFLLTKFHIDPAKDFRGAPVFSGAHDATVKLIESGRVAAGAVNIEVWRRMVRDKKVDLTRVKPLWTTPGYVDYVWTARKVVPARLRERFTAAFLALDAAQPVHQQILQLQGARKFVKAAASDFDAIEKVARSTGLLAQ